MNYRLTLAAAAGTALASTSLYVLFDGPQWFWAGLGAITVVAAIGLATQRRPLPVIADLAVRLAAWRSTSTWCSRPRARGCWWCPRPPR